MALIERHASRRPLTKTSLAAGQANRPVTDPSPSATEGQNPRSDITLLQVNNPHLKIR